MKYIIVSLFLILCIGCAEQKEAISQSTAKTLQADANSIPTPKTVQIPMKSLDEVMGKFEPKSHKDFVLIDPIYADTPGRYMHNKAYESFIEMWNHAKKDGIQLTIRSATRNFNYQKGIWERKWNGATKVSGKRLNETVHNHTERALQILEYSSMPGTSRHHWGTDIDLNAFENSYFESGEGLKIYIWLTNNAGSYGFCQPYTAKGDARPNGYNEEKWHWSFKPVAIQYFEKAKKDMKDAMIQGFNGSETAVEIGVVNKYILGVSQQCK